MTGSPQAALPLDGFRVVDLTRNLAGPYCTMMLGDMGAEVIKVESPAGGDELRSLFRFPGRAADTEDFFAMYNRNKRSLALDLKSPRGREVMTALIKKSDVFVQNLAPGAANRLGLDWERLYELNQKLVYVAISGFGPTSTRRAYDGVAQAASGAMDITGEPDGPPMTSGLAIGDLSAALFAAFATVSALFGAYRSGQGTRVDVAMMDCLLALHSGFATEYLGTGHSSSRLGAQSPHRVPYNVFATSDQRYVFLVTNNEIWPRLCRAVGLDELIDDPRYSTNQARVEHRAEVNAAIGGRIAKATVDEACGWFERHDVPHAKVATVAEALDGQHAREHDMVLRIDGALRGGREAVRVMGTPMKFAGIGSPVRLGPPALGEANDYVLRDILGYPADAIEGVR